MELTTAVPLIVTAALAFVGYLVTYRTNLRLSQRKERLERVNKQLADFYGPLFAMVHASSSAFETFRDAHWSERRHFFQQGVQPTYRDVIDWRRWVTYALMPLNRRWWTSSLLTQTFCASRNFPSACSTYVRTWRATSPHRPLGGTQLPFTGSGGPPLPDRLSRRRLEAVRRRVVRCSATRAGGADRAGPAIDPRI